MKKLEPEKVVEMLRLKGVFLTLEQAKLILDFLRKIANISVSQYLSR